jgi:NADPH-dependent ferric siderophore reductase
MTTSEQPVRIHRAEVVTTCALGHDLRRIVLGGDGLAGFVSTGVGDEYVRLFLPRPGAREPALPVAEGAGWRFPEGTPESPTRTYTVRRVDPLDGEVTIDVVLHQRGVASTWARHAKAGDVVGLNSPTGMYQRPEAATWQMLVADSTGLPAACRLMAQAPPHVRTWVWLEVPTPDHRISLAPAPHVAVAWLYGGNGRGPSRLEEVVRSLDRPEEPGYVWVAGETKVLRGVRRHLRHELGLPATAYKAVGYWVDHGEEWEARYRGLTDQVKAELDALWESDRDEEEIEDDVDARLEQLGL